MINRCGIDESIGANLVCLCVFLCVSRVCCCCCLLIFNIDVVISFILSCYLITQSSCLCVWSPRLDKSRVPRQWDQKEFWIYSCTFNFCIRLDTNSISCDGWDPSIFSTRTLSSDLHFFSWWLVTDAHLMGRKYWLLLRKCVFGSTWLQLNVVKPLL